MMLLIGKREQQMQKPCGRNVHGSIQGTAKDVQSMLILNDMEIKRWYQRRGKEN